MGKKEFKKQILLALIIVLMTAIFGFISSFLGAYFSTPLAQAWVQGASKCVYELNPYMSNNFNVNVNNFGAATGIFQACLSFNGYYCTSENQPLLPTVNPQLQYSTSFSFSITPNDDEKQNLSYSITVLCKQKIWFLERSCTPFIYNCNYEKFGSYKQYRYRLIQNV